MLQVECLVCCNRYCQLGFKQHILHSTGKAMRSFFSKLFTYVALKSDLLCCKDDKYPVCYFTSSWEPWLAFKSQGKLE